MTATPRDKMAAFPRDKIATLHLTKWLLSHVTKWLQSHVTKQRHCTWQNDCYPTWQNGCFPTWRNGSYSTWQNGGFPTWQNSYMERYQMAAIPRDKIKQWQKLFNNFIRNFRYWQKIRKTYTVVEKSGKDKSHVVTYSYICIIYFIWTWFLSKTYTEIFVLLSWGYSHNLTQFPRQNVNLAGYWLLPGKNIGNTWQI